MRLALLAIGTLAVVATCLISLPALVRWLDETGWQRLPPQFDHGRIIHAEDR